MSTLIGKAVHGGPSDSRIEVSAPLAVDPRSLLVSLELTAPTPVLAVCGARMITRAGRSTPPRGLARAIMAAARRSNAVVVDNGVDAGIDALLGAEGADNALQPVGLVGVAPGGLLPKDDGPAPQRQSDAQTPTFAALTAEDHHTHMVLADTDDWVATSRLRIRLIKALAGPCPVVMVVAGGDDGALAEACEAVNRDWPLVVVKGSGGAADRIAAAAHRYRGRDGRLRGIIAAAKVVVVSADDDETVTRTLAWILTAHVDPVLHDAWSLFAMYDRAAVDLRRTFVLFQGAVLVLGVVTTLLALLHQEIGTSALHWAVIAASIAVGGLITLTGRWATGKRWIVTRGAAESVKSEIFRYRTQTCWYADDRVSDQEGKRRADVLAEHLRQIQTRLMHTEASSGLLPPYEEHRAPLVDDASDDGLTKLEPEGYLELRIEDQMRYYERRLRKFARRRTVLRTVAVAASAAGALVAAAGAQIWVALTTAVAAAAIAYLAHLQVDKTIVVYNQSLARLEGLLRSWHQHAGHTPPPHAFGKLVHDTEAVLTAEHWGWVEQMSEAIREDETRQNEASGTPR